jgi:hypothetical protein
MRTAEFLARASAASRGLVASAGNDSTLAPVREEDRRRPAANKSVTFA